MKLFAFHLGCGAYYMWCGGYQIKKMQQKKHERGARLYCARSKQHRFTSNSHFLSDVSYWIERIFIYTYVQSVCVLMVRHDGKKMFFFSTIVIMKNCWSKLKWKYCSTCCLFFQIYFQAILAAHKCNFLRCRWLLKLVVILCRK